MQDKIEIAIAQIAGEPIRICGCGRTDAGVHATCQIAHFDTTKKYPETAWVRGVMRYLPDTVKILWAARVDEQFHARYSAQARYYRYILANRYLPPGTHHRAVGWHHEPLDITLMREAAQALVGRHDFSSFRAAGCQAASPMCEMKSVAISHSGVYRDDTLFFYFDFCANRFLQQMVRNIVGELIAIGRSRRTPDDMRRLLQPTSVNPSTATISASGLYFVGADYPAPWREALGYCRRIPTIG